MTNLSSVIVSVVDKKEQPLGKQNTGHNIQDHLSQF